MYFINATFTVPGKPSKKRISTTAPADAKTANLGATSRAKKAKTGSASSSTTMIAPTLPAKKVDPDVASRALNAAVASGVKSATGEVEEESLNLALAAGYSKYFILVQVANQRGDGDQKPASN